MQKRGGTDNLIRNYQWSSHHRAGLKCGRHGVAVRIHVIDEHRAAAANRFQLTHAPSLLATGRGKRAREARRLSGFLGEGLSAI